MSLLTFPTFPLPLSHGRQCQNEVPPHNGRAHIRHQRIKTTVLSCHRCQLHRTDDRPPPALLSSLPQPTEPNQRIHADLFGPLKMTDSCKKFILCITDALTKYVELVPLQNKEATTVAEAIFDKWICRFGTPIDLVTDQGTEFCAKLSNELFTRLGTAHLTTSSHHPQCNSQAEVANKTIAKYLSSFCDDSTLDWELYLAPLMFAYNTSFHRTIKRQRYRSPHRTLFRLYFTPRVSK